MIRFIADLNFLIKISKSIILITDIIYTIIKFINLTNSS